ncbi:hypothetical protein Q5O14_15840 [Eubacteriaceae bacterium ES2]|nr:hypothetical protein Q5O14_15840 [Eubacteriaceae bacterium ES2]
MSVTVAVAASVTALTILPYPVHSTVPTPKIVSVLLAALSVVLMLLLLKTAIVSDQSP